ncbi:MAG: mechanosensitive ion channel [Alphaproteobacteria bacterium]|nr:mechanosensitive ion channel [Alphaproteobacteria bacterium]MBU1516881.1 mechanosensitive ion channel [Alphaproteobacteria bacterium]MBU2092576.1 mechanosensitive ion channel [Alphaproteobacteria bacterium]MBU2151313.1 mechanosensitive ion channel [Alphaproteobacteria bacterium]MBU2309615.1 mechanosensitive ion channel [Alphaproteobacteria bacterium]
MFVAETPAKAASAADAAKPSFTEHLVTSTTAALDHILNLDPREAAINAGLSVAVVLAVYGLLLLVRRLSDHWLARVNVGGAEAEVARTQQAARLTWGLVRLAALAAIVITILGIWGVDARAWLSGDAGARLVRLALVIIIATALVEVSGFIIKRLIGGFARRSSDPRRAAQLRTLGPILTGCAQTVLVVVGGLTILTELGLKVGPILASAGVLGIAVGFGAQTLVKDFLTGLFLIAEDVVSVGDNVQIGDSSGVVEAMTLRTIRLRDANATLHVFPYSEAQVIHNRTKVFSSYLAEIPISYDSDLDHALAVIQKVGDDLRADPAFKKLITKPFEVMGVDRLAENAVHLKARFVTEPRAQWDVGREFNRRLKNAFDAEGILTPVKTTPVQAQPLEDRAAHTEGPTLTPPETTSRS